MARESVVDVLETRFGTVPASIRETILAISKVDHLRSIQKTAIQAQSLEGFEQQLEGMRPLTD